jgi:acyl-CoA dehydrogenase
MNSYTTDPQLLSSLADFVDREVVALEQQHEDLLHDESRLYSPAGGYSLETQDLMRTVRMASAKAGYYAMLSPTAIGGGGLGPLVSYEIWEFLYHRYGPGRLLPYQAIAHWTSGPSYLLGHMTEEMRDRVLSVLSSGERTMCFAMSEPDAGSDAWSMRTRAERDGDTWIINGTKQWISNSPHADFVLLFAVTDRAKCAARAGGISCFLIPADTPGFEIASVIKLFGHKGGNEGILSFTDVAVSQEQLVGDLHDGFRLALGGVSLGRMYNAGRCVGLARWALELAVEYAKVRTAFGHPIADYQGVSFQLAESAMEIYAAKTMALDCARRLEAGDTASREMAMVKAYTTEMCFRVYDRCMQVHGGMGLTNDVRLYDGWHQSRAVRIADGSGEIMRRNVARALLGGNTDF